MTIRRIRPLIHLTLLTAVVLLLAPPLFAFKKKPQFQLLTRPPQSMELEGARIVPAQENCENWAWAAALESALAMQALPPRQAGDPRLALDQRYWVRKAFGGELCLSSRGDFQNLQRAVNGEYNLEGRKLRLELRFVPGAPTAIDDLIVRTRNRQPTLLLWKGHTYLLAGLLYDEHIQRGLHLFVVREFRLLDPYLGEKAKAGDHTSPALVAFVNGRDDPAEIEGVMTVQITESPTPTDWLHRGK